LLPGVEGDKIDFVLAIEREGIQIINGEEVIDIRDYNFKEDSLIFELPVYDASISLRLDPDKVHGSWSKYELAGKEYNLFMQAFKSSGNNSNTGGASGINGKWDMIFDEEENPYPAVGIFEESDEGFIKGTILTETGDYRYLNGQSNAGSFKFQTFDGAHAFLFKGEIEGDSMLGEFRSGPKYRVRFRAKKNAQAALRDAKSLTRIKDPEALKNMCFLDKLGQQICLNDPTLVGKGIIIQILGSWCPNCRDEALLFQEFYQKYHADGLEILGLAYEYARDTNIAYQSIEKMRAHLGIEYDVIYGGYASKQIASEKFWMLSDILSFPTAIFINSRGEVSEVHTGFSGPGTGEVYEEYKRELELLVKSLL
jgi:thiol-disulfide isomerase/thioredoxin